MYNIHEAVNIYQLKSVLRSGRKLKMELQLFFTLLTLCSVFWPGKLISRLTFHSKFGELVFRITLLYLPKVEVPTKTTLCNLLVNVLTTYVAFPKAQSTYRQLFHKEVLRFHFFFNLKLLEKSN